MTKQEKEQQENERKFCDDIVNKALSWEQNPSSIEAVNLARAVQRFKEARANSFR